jgi:hypothetical protein
LHLLVPIFLWLTLETHGSVCRPFPVLLLRSAAVVLTMAEHEKNSTGGSPLSSWSNEPPEDVAETQVVHGVKSVINSSSVKEKISPIAVP